MGPHQWFMLHHFNSQFLKMLHDDFPNNWQQRASHSHATFLLEGLIIHLKAGGSQTNFQQFHNVFDQ
jgi:hypothetical protein